jgi:hypothetical protein
MARTGETLESLGIAYDVNAMSGQGRCGPGAATYP